MKKPGTPLGARIRAARQARSISQARLAQRIEVTTSTVSDWERGEAEPALYRLRDLARALRVDVAALIGAK